MTGHIGSGNTGGLWGTRLKQAGYDVLIIRGQSEQPVYIWIDDDKVEIRPASHIWGKNTGETTAILRKELDESPDNRISVLTIGPAGENMVRYAHVLNDSHHSAARCGAGAVLGVKKVKALAVRGTGLISVARPEESRS